MSESSPNRQIILFDSSDGEVSLDVTVDVESEDVWLTKEQMGFLFGRDRSVISRHVSNIYREGEVSRESTCAKYALVQNEGNRQVERQVEYYNLDVIISVGYRVKSQRGVEFRRWATGVLRRYVMDGVAENKRRLQQLSQAVQVIRRLPGGLESAQILDIVQAYAPALDLLDDYDHQRIDRPAGEHPIYVLGYEECMNLIQSMRFARESDIFGVEKDDSFRSSIAAIYQSFDGKDLYPSIQEKAANLLYFVIKNHSFHDGNKRIAACLFLYFLDRNGILFVDGVKAVDDSTLVAMTIMIAESRPDEKEAMVSLVMNFIALG